MSSPASTDRDSAVSGDDSARLRTAWLVRPAARSTTDATADGDEHEHGEREQFSGSAMVSVPPAG